MLEYRLLEMNDDVDYFVIVEATHTFTNNPKKLYFAENKHLFEKYLHKIIHVVVDDFPTDTQDPWMRERHQRDCIKRGVMQLDLKEDDIILISDLDEIIDVKAIQFIKQRGISRIYNLQQDIYVYNWYCKHGTNWRHAKAVDFKTFKSLTPEGIRRRHMEVRGLPTLHIKGGWHITMFFDNVDLVKNKMHNYSHQEDNRPTNQSRISLLKKVITCNHFRADSSKLHLNGNECDPKKIDPYLPPHYDFWYQNNRLMNCQELLSEIQKLELNPE